MSIFGKTTFQHASYAAFRPDYPNKLYDLILNYHRGPKKLCLELGCGPGTASRRLARHFDRVIATDPAAGMIKQAQEAKQDSEEGEKASDAGNPTRIEFRQASAESVPFVQDGQVDIVTAAQSSHWFDFPKLWPELSRVVRPGGTLAFWGYKDHVFVNFPKASEILQSYAYDSDPDRLGSYWPQPGRSYLQDQLRIIQPPREDWTDLERVEYEPATNGRASGQGTLLMERTIAIASCKAYIRTWSSYHGWKQAHPAQVARSEGGSGDVVDKMFDEMAQTHKHFDNEENEVEIEWGTALVMARRK